MNPLLQKNTTYGMKQNAYSGMIQREVVLDDLF